MEEYTKQHNYYMAFLHLIIAGLMVTVIILVMQNKELKQAKPKSEADLLKAGDIVPPFSGIFLEGEIRVIRFVPPTKKVVIFAFDTRCPSCKENTPSWIRLWQMRDTAKVSIYAVSAHNKERNIAYKKQFNLPYDILMPKDSTFLRFYKPNAVPLTLVIGNGGKVEQAWPGIMSQLQLEALEKIVR